MRKAVRNVVAPLVVLIALLLVVVYARYGGGQPYPDLSTKPLVDAAQMEKVLEYPEPIGNVAVNREGRVFFTVHPESRPTGNKLLEFQNGVIKAYPSEAAQKDLFDAVMGVAISVDNTLWTIDHGNHGVGTARLLAFDLATNQVIFDYRFPSEIAPLGSFLQALQVDSKGQFAYIADVSFWRKSPAIVVVDVKNRRSWRALDGHPSVMPQDWIVRNPIKDMVFFGGLVALKAGVDGIAVSKDDRYVVYGAMAHDTLYRIPTSALATAEAAAAAAGQVQAIGRKPLNDGFAMDVEGNVFITDVEHSGVARMTPQGKLDTMIRDDKRIRWADALSFGPDGWLYIADSAIPEQMLRSKEHIASRAPYFIYRFKPGTQGIPGQ